MTTAREATCVCARGGFNINQKPAATERKGDGRLGPGLYIASKSVKEPGAIDVRFRRERDRLHCLAPAQSR
jgi:hypothetical protein